MLKKLVACGAAFAGLALTVAALPADSDANANFGEIDARYRSAFSGTAWFVRQPGDTASPLDDPDLHATPRDALVHDRLGAAGTQHRAPAQHLHHERAV